MFRIIIFFGLGIVLINFVIWGLGVRKLIKHGIDHPSTKRFLIGYGIFLGVVFLTAFGSFGIYWFGQGSGPTGVGAIRQARVYLKSEYGKSPRGWSLTTRQNTIDPENPTSGHCLVEYEYAGRVGTLKATWTVDGYFIFEDITTKGAQQSPAGAVPKVMSEK